MKDSMIKAWVKVVMPLKNERGAQSLEWLGLAALLILVLGLVSQAVSAQNAGITEIIKGIFDKIKGMVGPTS